MDELDLLLEELALNPAGSDSVPEKKSNDATKREVPSEVCVGTTKNGKASNSSNVYSDVPTPVPAFVEPDSPTQELDSILQDLMGLAEGDLEPPTDPPSLTQKKRKRKVENRRAAAATLQRLQMEKPQRKERKRI